LSHNLVLESPHDKNIQQHCQRWFKEKCASILPGNDTEWTECLCALLTEALQFVRSLEECVRLIERDDSRAYLLADWEFRLRRHHPKHEFERLVGVVSKDIGHQYVDPQRISNRYFEQWSAQLQSLTGDYDVEQEARKLIEHSLINDAQVPLPITGRDIMGHLKIPPGPEVGRLLREARGLYEAVPCTAEELLYRLERHHDLQRIPSESVRVEPTELE
jgi:hypothetical protein